MIRQKEGEQKKALPKAYSLIKTVRLCFLALIMILLLWTVYNFREDINLDNIMRFFSYLDTGDIRPSEAAFRFSSSSGNRFAPFKNGLSVLSPEGITYLNPLGRSELEVKQGFGRPALRVNDSRILAYDIGGRSIMITTDYSVIMNKMADYPIINARLNSKNYLVLITNDEGYKAGLTVYNDKQESVYRWQTSEYYVVDASLSPDSKKMCALAFKYFEGEIKTTVFGFSLDLSEIAWEYDLGGDLAVSANYLENEKLAVLTETGLILLGSGGEEISRFDFEGMTLRSYSDEGEDFVSLLLARNRVGSLNLLVTLDHSGEVIAKKETDEVITVLRSRGDRVATLSAEGVKAYGRDLSAEGVYSEHSAAIDLQIGFDGRLFAISSASAARILE